MEANVFYCCKRIQRVEEKIFIQGHNIQKFRDRGLLGFMAILAELAVYNGLCRGRVCLQTALKASLMWQTSEKRFLLCTAKFASILSAGYII